MSDKIRVLENLEDMPLFVAAREGARREVREPEPVAPVAEPENAEGRRIGLFVDAENVRLGCLGETVEGLLKEGELRVRRAFGQWSAELSAGDAAVHVKHAIELRQCPRLTRSGKNAADIAMVVDVMKAGHWSVLRKVVWQAKQKKADGWKMLTEVGSGLAEEGVSAKDLGCASLSEACRQVPELEVEQFDGSGGYLVRFKDRSTAFSKREERILRKAMGVVVSENGWGRIADLAKELRDSDAWDFWKHQGRLKRRLGKLPWLEWHDEDAQLLRIRG